MIMMVELIISIVSRTISLIPLRKLLFSLDMGP
jgi:hypothetical protein